jgi:hypothetical protein
MSLCDFLVTVMEPQSRDGKYTTLLYRTVHTCQKHGYGLGIDGRELHQLQNMAHLT